MFFGSKCVKMVKVCILHTYKRVGVVALKKEKVKEKEMKYSIENIMSHSFLLLF